MCTPYLRSTEAKSEKKKKVPRERAGPMRMKTPGIDVFVLYIVFNSQAGGRTFSFAMLIDPVLVLVLVSPRQPRGDRACRGHTFIPIPRPQPLNPMPRV